MHSMNKQEIANNVQLTQQAKLLLQHMPNIDVNHFLLWWVDNKMLAGGSDLQEYLQKK